MADNDRKLVLLGWYAADNERVKDSLGREEPSKLDKQEKKDHQALRRLVSHRGSKARRVKKELRENS